MRVGRFPLVVDPDTQAMRWIKRAIDTEFERQVASVNRRLDAMRAEAKRREELGMPPFRQADAEAIIYSNEHAAWSSVASVLQEPISGSSGSSRLHGTNHASSGSS